LVAFVVVAGPAHAQTLTAHQALALDVFRELVEIDTTDSVGDNTAAARAMARRLLDAGFDPADVHVLEPAARKGNLVVRLRAPAATRPPVLFLAHLDVVEADPADWSVAPFTFLERDGYYYGRGTSDDKDEAAIGVANFIRLKQEGYLPTRDLILALTADEEGGDHNGVQFLLAEHRDLIDAAFVINEGGGGAILAGRRAVNSVQAAEKVYQSFTLEVTNRGGHSSLPRADNAIYQLSSALGRIAAYRFPVELNEVTRAFIRQTAITQAAEEAALARRLLEDPPAPEAVAHFDAEPGMNARLRTTCVATELEAGHAENALPQRARATVNCMPRAQVPTVAAGSAAGWWPGPGSASWDATPRRSRAPDPRASPAASRPRWRVRTGPGPHDRHAAARGHRNCGRWRCSRRCRWPRPRR
jgi:acetylornithine deacetylase/succinyl-diaminopimelate desuccinylase-like protein